MSDRAGPPSSQPEGPPNARAEATREASARDARTIRIIIVLVVIGWGLALALMGVAAVFWDRQ